MRICARFVPPAFAFGGSRSPESTPYAGGSVMARCTYCNDTGWVAIRSRDGSYAFAGPVPDDAKGYADADCWQCDSGAPPKALSDKDDAPSSDIEGPALPMLGGARHG